MANTAQTLTFAQLEALWINNGGSRALAPTMAAIAMAESSGNPAAMNKTDNGGRQTSWGLWQVSDGTHNMPRANILDPNVNAQAAVAKYKEQGLRAWGTYTSGAYREFLKNGVDPNSNGIPSGSTSTATDASLTGDIGGAIGEGLGNAFKALLQPLISTFIWGSEIALGMGLMLGGIIVFVINTNAGKNAISSAGTAVSVMAPEVSPAVLMQKRREETARLEREQRAAAKKAQKEAEKGNTSNQQYGKPGTKAKVKSA